MLFRSGVQDEVVEALFRGYFVDGLDIGNTKVLAAIGDACGLDGELVEELLESDADLESVEREDSMARKIGIQGVPTYLVGGMHLLTGAQDADVIARMIDVVAAGPADAAAAG